MKVELGLIINGPHAAMIIIDNYILLQPVHYSFVYIVHDLGKIKSFYVSVPQTP